MVFYPQCAVILRVMWEDFDQKSKAILQKAYDLPIEVRRVTVNINDYTHADTFDMEIDYKQFPFDPRAIRSCGVTIFMDDVGSLYSYGSDGQAINSHKQIKPSEFDNVIFQGFADEESITFDDTKRTVRLEGRDFTSLLIDRKYVGEALDMTQSLDVVLNKLLSQLDETKNIKVSNRVVELDDKNGLTKQVALPVLATFAQDKSQLGNMKNVRKDETYWDIIQDLVSRAGFIAYIELDKLVISNPRTLYNNKDVIKFVYGHNVSNLTYKRKLGRMKNFNLAVRSFNPEKKEVLRVLIPEEASEAWSKQTGIPNTRIKLPQPTFSPTGTSSTNAQNNRVDAPFIAFSVPNVGDKNKLISIAEGIYEEIGRQQIEGSFSTRDMSLIYNDIDGKDKKFNILKIRNGTPIRIIVAQGDLGGINGLVQKYESAIKSNKLALANETKETISLFLKSRGYKPDVASAMAETLTNPRLQSPFYTKAIRYTLDASQGFSCDVEFINFIQVRPPETTNAEKYGFEQLRSEKPQPIADLLKGKN